MKTKSKISFKYPCVCLCVHVSQITEACGFLSVLDSVNFKSVCTQTHIWVLRLRFSITHTHHHHHAGQPPHQHSLGCYHSLLNLPSHDWLSRYHHHQPITSQLEPPSPSHSQQAQRSSTDWLQSTDWQAVFGRVWGVL